MARRLLWQGILAMALFLARVQADTGPYIQPRWRNFQGPTFLTTDYVVGTYYFYWYNAQTLEHTVNADGSDALTEHPAESLPFPVPPSGFAHRPPARYFAPPRFSYDDPAWHTRELLRMNSAGIDFLLPVYWGVPGVRDWNNSGLQRLDLAMNLLDWRGQRRPSVGMFYDTTTLWGVDLTTTAGRDQFYGTIRDFYSWVPPSRWTRFQGRALVWLYWSGWPSRIDPAVFEEASRRFAAEFGGVKLFFVGDPGWGHAGAKLDLAYAWGAAVSGTTLLDVAAVGPGYDDRAVTFRATPTVVPRDGGRFYQNAWERVHSSGRRVVVVETWNEYHEGTEVAPTFEYGTVYTRMTGAESLRHRFPATYVPETFRYFPGRAPTADEYDRATRAMDAGTPCSAVREATLNLAEVRNRMPDAAYVEFLYRRYLNRASEPAGFRHWMGQLARGVARAAVRDAFLDSVEARGKIADSQFVTELYLQILLRRPEEGGYRFWLGALRNGWSRAAVRDGFVDSRELRYHDLSRLSTRQRMSLFDFSGWP